MAVKKQEKKNVEKKAAKKDVVEMKREEKQVVKFQPHTHVVIAFVAVVSLFLSLASFFKPMTRRMMPRKSSIVTTEDISYKIYIGLTDKDANYQTLAEDVATELVKTICIQHNQSYTIYNVQGGFKDEENKIHTEKTIILELDKTNEEVLYSILNDVTRRINNGSVMVVKNALEVFEYQNSANK